MKVPGKPMAAGKTTASFTDLVDVFPTVAVAAGLPLPQGVDGMDVSALFDDPDTAVKQVAYHQYPACNMATEGPAAVVFNHTRGACNEAPAHTFAFMGSVQRGTATLWPCCLCAPAPAPRTCAYPTHRPSQHSPSWCRSVPWCPPPPLCTPSTTTPPAHGRCVPRRWPWPRRRSRACPRACATE